MPQCRFTPASEGDNPVRIFEEIASEGFPVTVVRDIRSKTEKSIDLGLVTLSLNQTHYGRTTENRLSMKTELDDGTKVFYYSDSVSLIMNFAGNVYILIDLTERTNIVRFQAKLSEIETIRDSGLFRNIVFKEPYIFDRESGIYEAEYVNIDLLDVSIDKPCLADYFSQNPFVQQPMQQEEMQDQQMEDDFSY